MFFFLLFLYRNINKLQISEYIRKILKFKNYFLTITNIEIKFIHTAELTFYFVLCPFTAFIQHN